MENRDLVSNPLSYLYIVFLSSFVVFLLLVGTFRVLPKVG